MQVDAWENLNQAMIQFAQGRIRPRLDEMRRSKAEGTAAPDFAPDPVFDVVFRGFSEITATCEVMRDVEIYMRRFPFVRLGVPRNRYLRYHIHAYLGECYILRERLAVYAVRIGRLYRKATHAPIAERAARAREIALTALDGIARTRGGHVHELRFTDTELDNLAGTELVASYSTEQLFQGVLEWQHREARARWKGIIANNNEALSVLLGVYALELYPVLFNDKGDFIEPIPRGV